MIWKKIFAVFLSWGLMQRIVISFGWKNVIVESYIASASAALVWGMIYSLQGEVLSGGILLLMVPSSGMWFLGGFYPSSIMMI